MGTYFLSHDSITTSWLRNVHQSRAVSRSARFLHFQAPMLAVTPVLAQNGNRKGDILNVTVSM
jgi:hypothetical protein